MKNIRITRSVIPNIFTALNMFSGFVSIVYAGEGKFIIASWFIIIGAIFDTFDGIIARLTNSSSKFGVELDSLSDLVSFGVAPAFLIYTSFLKQYGAMGIVISSLLMIFGGLRLARFNVELTGFDKSYFTGLPVPSSAITLASFVISYYKDGIFPRPSSGFIIPLVFLLSLLMVSKIRYESLPKFTLNGIKEKPVLSAFILISIISMLITKGNGLFCIFMLMLLTGIIRHIYFTLFPARKKTAG
ncbi:MAG: CDP-diacylglycerol--serine O-phosphatidyltransferase [Ignavibacteria bacterium]